MPSLLKPFHCIEIASFSRQGRGKAPLGLLLQAEVVNVSHSLVARNAGKHVFSQDRTYERKPPALPAE